MLEANIKRGNSARTFDLTELHGEVAKWVDGHSSKFLTDPLYNQFRSDVANVAVVKEPELVTFRGRCCENPPGSVQMGPPRLIDTPGEGRYHEAGERILYLSSSPDGCLREIVRWIKPGMPYIQEFRLPTHKLRIADFVDLPDSSLLTYVFERAESLHVTGLAKAEYGFSQMVANTVADLRFDGMIMRGSRGEPGKTYTNTVIFQPHPGWEAFLAPGCSPVPGFSHNEIAERAYLIWERQGKPVGMHVAHWFLAVEELKRARSTP